LYETIIPPYGTGANTQASSLCYHGALSWKQNIVPMELGYATKTSPAET